MEKAILIFPAWKSQPSFPRLIDIINYVLFRLDYKTQGLTGAAAQLQFSPTLPVYEVGCCDNIRKALLGQRIQELASQLIISSWRPGTQKQYRAAWKQWFVWNRIRFADPFQTTDVIEFLQSHVIFWKFLV